MKTLVTIDNDLRNVLRTQAQQITKFGKQLNPIIDDMFAVMEFNNGAGFAAPQIGISQRIIIVGRIVLLNPVIVQCREEMQITYEGCLSIPDVSKKIKRFNAVAVAYLDKKRTQYINWFRDNDASIVQHEIDHLNGRLIIDYEDEVA